MSFGHDVLKLFFAVSTLGNVKIHLLGESESLNFLAIFQCARHTEDLTNRVNYF